MLGSWVRTPSGLRREVSSLPFFIAFHKIISLVISKLQGFINKNACFGIFRNVAQKLQNVAQNVAQKFEMYQNNPKFAPKMSKTRKT